MDAWTMARSLLPEPLAAALAIYPDAEELRLRRGRPPGVVIAGREQTVNLPGVSRETLLHVLEKATGASLHAAAPALRGGYLSYRGLRIGVCGEAVYNGETMNGLRSFSSLSIRIPHDCAADCAALIEKLISPAPGNVLITAPPGVGKTSFLRELIRKAARTRRVSVIDDRNELAACFAGDAQFDLGPESDVLVGVPKGRAAMMLLRGMNPQIIAMDEITDEEDLRAACQIAGCGVLLFATAHGRDREDMLRRPLYRNLLSSGIFSDLIKIRCLGGKRVYERESLSG